MVLNGSNHSLFIGDVDIDRSQTQDSQINLSGSSVWTGASSGLNMLTLNDNSQWNIMDNSSVDALTANNSVINVAHNTANFTVLTVNGNYTADNATLVMNAALGGDTSATDRLHVLGDVNATPRSRLKRRRQRRADHSGPAADSGGRRDQRRIPSERAYCRRCL